MESKYEIEILGKTYTQYWEDSEGKPPCTPPGTRVTMKLDGEWVSGTVLLQRLHWDMNESFFGNVIINTDDGRYIETHSWMTRREEDEALQANKSETRRTKNAVW